MIGKYISGPGWEVMLRWRVSRMMPTISVGRSRWPSITRRRWPMASPAEHHRPAGTGDVFPDHAALLVHRSDCAENKRCSRRLDPVAHESRRRTGFPAAALRRQNVVVADGGFGRTTTAPDATAFDLRGCGVAPGPGRHLRRDGVRRGPAPPRDRRADVVGCATPSGAGIDPAAGHQAFGNRNRCGAPGRL